MNSSRQRLATVVYLLIWLIGVVVLFGLWEVQKLIPSPAGSIIATIINIISFFYVFALFPIKVWVFSWKIFNIDVN